MRYALAVLLFCAGIFCLAQSNAQVPMTGAGLGAPGGAAPSTPATIFGANLYAWYYADRGGVTQSGGVVSAVADQSGNGLNLSVNNSAPTWSASSFNSQPGVTHSNASLDGLLSTNNNINSNVASFFIVAKISSANLGRVFVYNDGSTDFNSTHTWALIRSNANEETTWWNSNPYAGTINDNANVCVGNVFDSVNVTQYEGTTQTAQGSATGTLGSATTTVGLGFVGQTNATFTWAEVVVTKNAATSGQRSSLTSYFNSHWGISC